MAGVKYASSVVKLRGWVANGATREYRQVLGTDASVSAAVRLAAGARQFFRPADVAARRPVAVLGAGARDQLFGADVNPVGRDSLIRDATVARRRRRLGRRRRSDGDGVRAVHRAAARRSASSTFTASSSRRRRPATRRGSPTTSSRCCARGIISTSTRRWRGCGRAACSGNQMPQRELRRARRLHGEDAGGRSADQGALHVGRRVRPREHAEGRSGQPRGDERHAAARRHDDDGAARRRSRRSRSSSAASAS